MYLSLAAPRAPRSRYALGSGNSIPSYITLENYLTMLDTALTYEPLGHTTVRH